MGRGTQVPIAPHVVAAQYWLLMHSMLDVQTAGPVSTGAPLSARNRLPGIVRSVEVDGLLAWLDETNTGRPRDERVTLFHVFLTAIGRTIRLRPQTNRFIAGWWAL